jgi:ATP-dependent protease HslVU (ClpYQ) peptidase subunit
MVVGMTTIVCTKDTMACDSQITNGKMADGNVKKMWRLRDGSLVGVCGTWDQCLEFIKALKAGDIEEWTWKDMDAYRIDGKHIWCYDGNMLPYKLLDKFATLGSGGDVAKGAMIMGATPIQAVRAAKKIDTRTGGRITQLRVKPR